MNATPTPGSATPRALEWRVLLVCGLLHTLMLAVLRIQNVRDPEIAHWRSPQGHITGFWDFVGHYTPTAFFTSMYLFLAGALAWAAWLMTHGRGRPGALSGWFLPAAGSMLLFCGVDEWFRIHSWLRDDLLMPWLGFTSANDFPLPLRSPAMTLYALLAIGATVYVCRKSDWGGLVKLVMIAASVLTFAAYLLDGMLGVAIGFTVEVVAVEELLELCAAFLFAMVFLLGLLREADRLAHDAT